MSKARSDAEISEYISNGVDYSVSISQPKKSIFKQAFESVIVAPVTLVTRTAYNVITFPFDLGLDVIATLIKRSNSNRKFISTYLSDNVSETIYDKLESLIKSYDNNVAFSPSGILVGFGLCVTLFFGYSFALVDKVLGVAFGAVEGAYNSVKKLVAHEYCAFRDAGKSLVGTELEIDASWNGEEYLYTLNPISVINFLGGAAFIKKDELPFKIFDQTFPTPILKEAIYIGRESVVEKISDRFRG